MISAKDQFKTLREIFKSILIFSPGEYGESKKANIILGVEKYIYIYVKFCVGTLISLFWRMFRIISDMYVYFI